MQQSVTSLFTLYLERSDFRDATIEFKWRTMTKFTGWFGDLPVESINATHAEDYRAMLGKTLKPKSVRGYIDNLKPFFSWLQKRGYVDQNPFCDIRVAVDEVLRTTFTVPELGRIMTSANELERLQVTLGRKSHLSLVAQAASLAAYLSIFSEPNLVLLSGVGPCDGRGSTFCSRSVGW